MDDLRAVVLRALAAVRPHEIPRGPRGVRPEEWNQIAVLAEALTPATRLVIEAKESSGGYALTLEGLASGGPVPANALAAMLRLMGGNAEFRTALAQSGECRADTPYAPIQPIIEPDGTFRWCCTHPSGPHCSSS